jgi:hypothetical protein
MRIKNRRRSQWPSGLRRVCGPPFAETAGSNLAEGMDVCLLSVVCLSGRGLCDGLITRPEKSYRL